MSLNDCIIDFSNANLKPNRRGSRITFKRRVNRGGFCPYIDKLLKQSRSWNHKTNWKGLEQQVRGVQVRLECRCIEELKPKPVYLEVTEGFSDFSKNIWLTSIQDGKVRGTTEAETEGTILILVPVGLRQVAILHKSTNRYLAMNIQGKLHTTVG